MHWRIKRKAGLIKAEWKEEYREAVEDVLEHPVIRQMEEYQHHCDTNCLQHCINVSYHNFRICKVLGLDARAAARAGLMHDLFLYDWRFHAELTGDNFHAMTHPRRALENAEKHFELSEKEKDIILKHMWPLTVVPPKSMESLIIGFVDKACGMLEITGYYSAKWVSRRPQRLDRRTEK